LFTTVLNAKKDTRSIGWTSMQKTGTAKYAKQLFLTATFVIQMELADSVRMGIQCHMTERLASKTIQTAWTKCTKRHQSKESLTTQTMDSTTSTKTGNATNARSATTGKILQAR